MSLHISIAPEPVFEIAGIQVSNSLITSLIVTVILLGIAYWANVSTDERGTRKVPTVITIIVEIFHNFMHGILGEMTDTIFPIVFTYFMFIILGNWIELLPGVGTIGFWQETTEGNILTPLFRGPNADLSMTLAMAISSVAIVQYFGVKKLGVRAYFSKFINIKSPMHFVLGVLETVQEFSKIISFSFRLFGNIFAGEVLIAVITFLVPLFLPVPFIGLEVFIGFIQALVFSVLTAIFVAVAVEPQHI